MKTEKTNIDLNFNQNPLINIGVKVLVVITFGILLHGFKPLFPLPFDSLFKLKWMFINWKFIGTQGFFNYTQVRFERGVLLLLAVVALIFLLKKSPIEGLRKYIVSLVIFGQIFLISADIITVIFNISDTFFDPIMDSVFKYWGFITLVLFLPFLLGNKISNGLPSQYLDFVKKFFLAERLKLNILMIFSALTAISYLFAIV